MPPRGHASDIVRLVRGVSGRVKLRMELVIRFGFGTDIPWVKRTEDGALLAICGPDMTVLRTPVETRGEDMTTVADFEVSEGETIPFVLTYGPSHLPVPEPIDPVQALQDTEDFWTEWCSRCTYEGDSRDLVMRSLITLKALTYVPTGGIVAAPTTSLPEKLGGARNWDYRFCWLRDATFTLLALMNSGYTEEASCLAQLAAARRRRSAGEHADHVRHQGSAPPAGMGSRLVARLRRRAAGSDRQRRACPVAARCLRRTDRCVSSVAHGQAGSRRWDRGTWNARCSSIWRRYGTSPISGIWERRGDGQHYVSSKVMTWVAFDRGIKSAEKFGFDAPLDRWRDLRDTIHRDVCENGFDREQNAFVDVLWIASARCQHPAAAVGGLPAGFGPARSRHASRPSKNT